jgi:hypothetical protein
MVIYKYILKHAGHQTVDLPFPFTILRTGEQHGNLCIWVHHDPDAPKKQHDLHMFGTGETIPDRFTHRDFIDTVQMSNGMVWHLFGGR